MLYRAFCMFFTLSLMGSVLALMIMLVKTSFKTRFSAKWHYYVWILLLLRLIVPFAPQHDLSVFNLFRPVAGLISNYSNSDASEPDYFVNTPVVQVPSTLQAAQPPQTGIPASQTPAPGSRSPFSIDEIIGLIWVIGAATLLFSLAASNLKFSMNLRKKAECRDPDTLNLMMSCRRELGIIKHVPVVLDGRVGSPLLFGLAKPRILASKELLGKLSQEGKRYVFLHELTHLKKKDILINWITAIIKCVYWFNPIIWYACTKIKEDCEFSCDESVLEHINPMEHQKYGQTILNLMNMRGKPYKLTCTTGMTGRKSAIKRRIYMIAGFKKKTIAWTLTAAALTLLVGCSALTGAKTDILNQPSPSINDQAEQQNSPEGKPAGEQVNQDAQETASPASLPDTEQAVITIPKLERTLNQSTDDIVSIIFVSPVSSGQEEELINNLYDKFNAGETVVYDKDRKISGFVMSQTIDELSKMQVLYDSGEDLQKYQDRKETILKAVKYETIEKTLDNAIKYYIDKLKDKSYTGTYGDGYTWYTAAEELGRIGKPAIPYLIDKLSTTDDYERALALYALLLATQQENVNSFTGGEYINVNLDFDPANHPAMVKTAMDWWEKYKNNF